MASKISALIIGFVYLFFGISGLFPSFLYLPPHRLRYFEMEMIGRWGFLFGWLPSNLVHSIVYIILGAAGVLTCLSFAMAIRYCRGMFAITLLFTVLGFLPGGVSYLGGFMPLFSWNIMLHTVTTIAAYYYGWVYPLDLGGPEPESEMI